MSFRLAGRVLKRIMREEFEKLREEARLRIDESNKQISDFGVALRGLDQVVSAMGGSEGSYRFQEHYQLWRITNSGGWRHD